jgi:hypothetical protein
MGIGLGGDGLYYPFVDQALALVGLDETDLEVIMPELAEQVGDEDIFQLENQCT